MAEKTETQPANNVSIEELGPCLRKLTITVPGDAVAGQIDTSLAILSQQAQIPGFRPGRAPKRLIEKKFGSEIRDEARQRLVSDAYQQAVRDNDLEVVAEPEADHLADIEIEPGKDVIVELEVEVAPTFDIPSYEGVEVKKPIIEIPDERVDKAIERMQINEGDLQPQESPEPGDYLIGRGIMREKGAKKDDDPILDIPGAVVQVPKTEDQGKGMILGVVVDDFAKQLGSPKPGESATIKCKGPESHEREDVRGKDLEIEFEVEQVQRIIPADINALCERLGMMNEQMLKNAVRQRLEQRVATDQQAAMRQQVAQHLIAAVDFELPQKVTDRQAERNLQRQALDMRYRGIDQTIIEQRLAELRSQSQDAAKRELKLFFVLARIAKELEIQVSDQEIAGHIAMMAQQRGERPDKLRDQLVKSGQVNLIAQQIREHKALDAILEKAKIEELPVEEYNKHVKDAEHVAEIDETPEE